MTPNQLVLEYWKYYGAYMQRKEHLIEVTTTVYLAFVSALLLRDTSFWLDYARLVPALVLWLLTMLLVLSFVTWQFRLWSDAARICNACQTLMARWLAQPPNAAALKPVSEQSFPDVQVPQALADEIEWRRARWRDLKRCQRLCASRFELVVYGLGTLWTVALLVRVWTGWHHPSYYSFGE
jgi:hypothetical protein